MNRTTLCKKIIQSIHDYITDPDNLEAHRSKGHFVRKRKLSMFQIILYLLYTSKASMFQNLSRIKDEKPGSSFIRIFLKNFFISLSICFTSISHTENFGMAIIYLLSMVLN